MTNGLSKDKSRSGLAGRPAVPVLLARRVFPALLLLLLVLAGLAAPAAAQVVSIAGGGGVTEGGTATFTLTVSPAPPAPMTVTVDVTDSGRFAGAGQTGARTVTVGTDGTGSLTVTTVDDNTDEPKGAITAVVGSGTGYVLGSPSSAAVTVVDNDLPPPFIVSIAGGSSVTEGGAATFTLTMSAAPPAPMTVTVDVTDSGSFAGTGQTGARDVTIATDGTGSFTVTTVNDSADEPNGVIGARVRAGDDYRVGPPSSAAVSVLDDDVAPPSSKPVVWFGDMPKTVQEGGFINLNVKVHPQLNSPMTIYFSHGGTATVGSDYDIGNRGSGRTAVEMHANAPGVNYAMPIADDVVEEGDETAVITLVADEAYTVGEPGAYVLTIKDSSAPQVSLSSGAGCGCTEGDKVAFTLAADPAPSAPLAVTLTVGQNGDHVGPSALGRRTVTVPVSGSVTVSIPTMDDAVDEPDGTVTATVEAGSGYTLGASSSLAVDVADNDGLPRLSFAERRVDVAESDNPGATTDAVLTVQLSAKSDKPVTFEYALSGRATAGEDYEAPQSTSATIAPGSTSADLVFKVKDDPRHETLETIFVTLTDPVNALAPAPGNKAVVLISSDDGPPVLSVETSSVVEPPPGYGRYMPFALTLTPASGLDVDVDVADTMTGTASNVHTCYGYCEDYVTGRSRVQFAPGETYKVVHLGVLSDARDEEDETVVVRLSAASKQVTFAEGTLSGTRWVLEVAGTIEDDDTRGIEVTPTSLALAAPDGAGSYKVSLTSQPTHIVTVELSSDDPAVATVSPARLTFNPVNWDKPRTVTVTAVDDDTDNAGGARTATVSHTVVAGTSDYGAVTVPDVTVTVSGGDPAALTSEPAAEPVTVSLSAEASSIAEAYGKTKFRIELSRALVAGEMVKVPFTIDGGKWKQDWHVKFQDAHNGPGVERTQSGRKSAVRFTEGGRVATLVLVARPNEDTEARTISIAFGTGKRAPRATGVAGGIALAGEPIAVAIIDDDLVALSVDDAKAKESKRWMRFTVRLSAKVEKPVTVSLSTRPSSPVSAREGADYRKLDTRVRFAPGETEKEVKVRIFDDSHNEGPETFEVFLSRSSAGAGIADGVAVGTITNDDPLPGAWLARFGRAVAERALDGITARMAADRTPGLRGSIAGQALDFVPAASDGAELSPGSGAGAGPGSLSGAGFGQKTQGQARGMTMQEVLWGSSFSLTGEADSSGGTLAFWGGTPGSGGLVSGSRFSGDQRGDGTAVGLHGETATALLGTDYARGRWLVGFALSETRAEGGHAAIGGAPCSDADASLCAAKTRAGDGDVEASLTATIPYAALAVTDRLRLWGAAGQGAGDVTVKTGTESLRADTAWSMAAAGIRGDLLAPAAGSADGPSLAVVSDALWVRTSSEKVSGLAASESDVSRLRLGLEGSWGLGLSGGGAVTPRLELGARHDGGDAETGFGVELGGGLAWHDPKLGLRLDLSGRTLVAHDDGALEDRGVSAQLAYDPSPASGRGLSLSLGQDWGGRAQGGLDALFAPEPLEDRAPGSGSGAGGSEAASRWSMEAAWGLPVLGNRFTGSPWMGLGLAAGARDYSLGWRLTPEAASAPDLSFGLKATRRESDTADPEHRVGIEVRARW